MKEILLSPLEAQVILKAEKGLVELSAQERQMLREIKIRFEAEPFWFWHTLVWTAISILAQVPTTLGPGNNSVSFSTN